MTIHIYFPPGQESLYRKKLDALTFEFYGDKRRYLYSMYMRKLIEDDWNKLIVKVQEEHPTIPQSILERSLLNATD